jgi:hypothetical protein
MARRKSIDSHTEEILRKFNLDPKECLWDCHGTWILLHKWVVVIGQRANIRLDPPEIINADQSGRMGLVLVRGRIGETNGNERHAWSFGEAAPYNNKNAYPFAMAEKRAKDRVILELVGLAGHVYTDQDVADIKAGKPVWELKEPAGPSTYDAITKDIGGATEPEQMTRIAARIRDDLASGVLRDEDRAPLLDLFQAKSDTLGGE